MYTYFLIILLFFIISNSISQLIIRYIKGNLFLRILRISTAYLPYLLIFCIYPFPNINFTFTIPSICLMTIFLVIMLIPEYQNFIFSIKKDFTFLHKKVKGQQLLSRSVECTIVPIIEELFFRGLIPIDKSFSDMIIISILLILLFNISHYIGMNKSKIYQLKILLFSIFAITLYIFSGSLAYPIIFHICYNLPYVYSYFHRYYFHQ